MFRPFANWIARTPLSIQFQERFWVVPTSQSIHIVAVSLVFASAMVINGRLLGIGRSYRTVSQVTRTLVPWMWAGLVVLLLTGLVQTVAEPVRQFVTPVFWIKMGLIVLVTGMTAYFAHTVRDNPAAWDAPGSRAATGKTFAWASIFMWVSIVVCGRFIGYTWELFA